MINLSDELWLSGPGEKIVLEGEGVKDFCDVLERLYEKVPSEKEKAQKMRAAIRLGGDAAGDFGPHFGRRWTAEYAGEVKA